MNLTHIEKHCGMVPLVSIGWGPHLKRAVRVKCRVCTKAFLTNVDDLGHLTEIAQVEIAVNRYNKHMQDRKVVS